MRFREMALAHARSRASGGTRALYEADLKNWLEWCQEKEVDPTKPTLANATDYRDKLEDEYAALTVRRVLAALSSMYEAALATEDPAVTWNPFKRLPRPPGDTYNQTEAISNDHAKKVLKTTAQDVSMLGLRDYAILCLLYHTGIRRKSIALLRRQDLVRRGEQLIAKVIVKGNKRREVELPEPAAKALNCWLVNAVDELVFAITPSAITEIVKRRGEAAGVDTHPHQFRAAFITNALDGGAELHDVQAAVHHADPKTTLRYDRGQRGIGVTSRVAAFREKEKE